MKLYRFFHLIFFLVAIVPFIKAQEGKKADMLKELQKTSSDTGRVRLLNSIAWNLKVNKVDSAVQLSKEALELALKSNFKQGEGICYHELGEFHWRKGDFPTALEYYNKALGVWDELEKNGKMSREDAKKRKATTIGNMGIVYLEKDDVPKAIEYYRKALAMDEELGNQRGVSRHLGNLASVYMNQGNYAMALEYNLKSLKIIEALGVKEEIAGSYYGIGGVYYFMHDYDRSLNYYSKALKIQEQLGNKTGIDMNLGCIGNVYLDKNDDRAEEYYFRALKLAEEIGNQGLVSAWTGNLGLYYFKKEKYDKALEFIQKALHLGEKMGDISSVAANYDALANVFSKQKKLDEALKYYTAAIRVGDSIGDLEVKKSALKNRSDLNAVLGNYKEAYKDHLDFSRINDSLFNEAKHREITRKELNYEFEKKENDLKAEQEKNKAIADAEATKKNVFIVSVIAVLCLVGVFSVFLFKRYRITQKQNALIEKQKHLVEEKNKEVLDSITYAKRLQVAVLPDKESSDALLEDYFVLFKPRDIVSGDFYFIEPVRTNDGRHLVAVAVADCTGHGVPGAFMSMLGYDILKNSLGEKHVNSASEALDYLNNRLSKTLRSTGKNQQVRDGMDIAFCVFYKETMKLYFSGAHNDCWIIKKDGSFHELRADKQPVGYFENSMPFTLKTMDVESGDCFYLFSDGYPDQFGGPSGKKFKRKQLREKLIAIHQLSMNQQQLELEKTFNEWKGALEQVDDVCMVGVRV